MVDPHPASAPSRPDWYRYLILIIGFATLAGASGVTNVFQVFYSALLGAFNWSHEGGARVYSINQLVVSANSLLMGWLLDRFGPRWLYTAAACVIGIAFLACSRLHSLVEFGIFYGIVSAFGQAALLSMTVVVARCFAHDQRGRAIGIADVGTGFGMVAFVPGSAWLIEWFGWRQAFALLGAVVIVILVPLNLLHRPTPTPHAPTPLAGSLRDVMRSNALWLLCTTHFFMTVTMTMVNVHLVEFLVSSDVLPFFKASMIAGGLSLVSLPGRIFFGWFADRVQPNRAFSTAMSCTMLGFIMLLLLTRTVARWPLLAFVVIYGFAQGAGGIAVAAKTVGLFQGPYLGRIFMLVNLSATIGAAIGGWFGGWLFDYTGSYALTFVTAIVSGACAIGWMWMGGPVPVPTAVLSQQR
jgi:predicted MFS family arabinose efflux permease